MIIRINGKEEPVGKAMNIGDIVSQKKLIPDHIVIEHNFKIVSQEEWHGIQLKENDNIEIVSFIGGG